MSMQDNKTQTNNSHISQSGLITSLVLTNYINEEFGEIEDSSIEAVYKNILEHHPSAEYTATFLETRSSVERKKFYKRSINTCHKCGTYNPEITGRNKKWACGGCYHIHDTKENMIENVKSLHFTFYMFDLFDQLRLVDQIPDKLLKGTPVTKTKYHAAKNHGVVVNLNLAIELTRRYGMNIVEWWYKVRKICADNGSWYYIKDLEVLLSRKTGLSKQSCRRNIKKLREYNLVYEKDKKIYLYGQQKLARWFKVSSRRSFRLSDIFSQTFKITLIRAAHRYFEDGYYRCYPSIKAYIEKSKDNLTLAQILSFPNRRDKVGCAAFIVAERLNIAQSTVYNSLKDTVILQENKFFYTHYEFNSLFSFDFFRENPRFTFKKSRRGVWLINQIASKSTYTELFNVSRVKKQFSKESYERFTNLLVSNKLEVPGITA